MCGPWFGSWSMFPGMLIPLLIFAVIIYLIIRGMGGRGMSCAGRQDQYGERPLDILNRRYVKGEISQEDFDRIKRDIE